MSGMANRFSIGQCATLACILEATAPKVGNVHRGADFADLTLHDFLVSAVAIAPAIEAAAENGVGQAVLAAIRATRTVVATNTNLGIVLLLAPLATVPAGQALSTQSLHKYLHSLTAADAAAVYEAIHLAQPGGMGKVKEMDVAADPPPDLLAAMRAAEGRDLIAQQYATDFSLVLDEVVPQLVAGRTRGWSLTDTIIHTHLTLLARHPDSLVARKCGMEVAKQASALASQVLSVGEPPDEAYYEAVADFDFWLRSDGHRRNPGTTADLIAAGLFAALRDDLLKPPYS
jgi:triphosphoribosyl-dephospho-CoA synthase